MIGVVPSCWSASRLCREAESERARRDAELAKEAERIRRRNKRIWERCGAAVPGSTTNQGALGTARNGSSPESAERRLTKDTIRYRLASLLLVRGQTCQELADTVGMERRLVAMHVNALRIAGFVRGAGRSGMWGSNKVELLTYEITENGRKELAAANERKIAGRGRRMEEKPEKLRKQKRRAA